MDALIPSGPQEVQDVMGFPVLHSVPARSPVFQPSRFRALRTNRFLALKGVDPGNGLVVSNS